jgi:hypothetical protein
MQLTFNLLQLFFILLLFLIRHIRHEIPHMLVIIKIRKILHSHWDGSPEDDGVSFRRL